MKRQWIFVGIAVVVPLLVLATGLSGLALAQGPLGSGFTYQGQLMYDGAPITATCAMTFTLYDAASAGSPVGSPVGVSGVAVTNGLFTVPLDFGSAAFGGEARWLGIRVACPQGSGSADLGRQPLSAAPYALYAASTGALHGRAVSTAAPSAGQVLHWDGAAWAPAADADTTYSAGYGLALSGTQFGVLTGTIQQRVSGECAAGAAMRVIAADGAVTCEPVDAGAWSLTGNAGTTPGANFLGTTDNQALELKVNNARALRLEPNAVSPNVVGGYSGNSVSANRYGATIGGGGNSSSPNRVSSSNSVVGGGAGNLAGGDGVNTIGGGAQNTAGGMGTTIGGGQHNTASRNYATVGGGASNVATNAYATVGGGISNTASGTDDVGFMNGGATVGGGGHNTASGDTSTIAGGSNNTASGIGATIGGGGWDGSYFAGNQAGGNASTIGGGVGNQAGGNYATVGGGKNNGVPALYATVGGGETNTASSQAATVGGGASNVASSGGATIAGGGSNYANGWEAAIGGGYQNQAGGSQAAVPGGGYNTANGDYSFAAGRRAKANSQGCFVWGDSTDADVTCAITNAVIIRASGGVTMYTDAAMSVGAYLPAGNSAWAPLSDRALKANVAAVDGSDVLARLAQVPVSTWNYTSQDPSIRHMGPMAQDFHAAFGLGEDDKHITTVDADGVALAAIQALYAQNQALAAQNASQQAEIDALKARLAALEAGGGR